MDKPLRNMLHKEVLYKERIGTNDRNVPTFASSLTLICFIYGNRTIAQDSEGEEIVSNITLIFEPNEVTNNIKINDVFTISEIDWPVRVLPIPYYDDKGQIYCVEVNL